VICLIRFQSSLLQPDASGSGLANPFHAFTVVACGPSIASGSPVPLKREVVLKVRLQEGLFFSSEFGRLRLKKVLTKIAVRMAIRSTSAVRLRLRERQIGMVSSCGGRALDCEARRGLGLRPGPGAHILDTLGVQIPRCEDHSAERKDRAYVFESEVSAVESTLARVNEPGAGKRALLVFAMTKNCTSLALVPVARSGDWVTDIALTEAVLPIEGKVEAVPGLWDTDKV